MRKTIIFALAIVVLTSCNTKQKEKRQAQLRVEAARELAERGNMNAAKLQLDSVHLLFPRQVEARRSAKALMDSIVYVEAQRNLQYSDSLLQPLLPKVDELLKKFNHEKNGEYEDYGRYVHKQLPTSRNIGRCFLQSYVNEDVRTTMKSYYYGVKNINHDKLTLSVGEDYLQFGGDTHSFDADGAKYEILTLSEEDALSALQFIANHASERVKVTLSGSSDYVYYLNQTEKQALAETCELALAMRDVRQLEQQINIANAQIAKYEERH